MNSGSVTYRRSGSIDQIDPERPAFDPSLQTSQWTVSRLKVQLISRQDSRVTGLSRYAETLKRHFSDEPVDVSSRFPAYPLPEMTARLGRRIGWDLRTFWQSYPLWSDLPPADLYHLTSETLATLLLTTRKQPMIVTVHGPLSYLLRADRELSTYNHLLDRWFDSLAVRGLRRADAIIAVSNYLRTVFVERVGLDPDRIHVVPEAVDHSVFRPVQPSDEFRRRYMANDRRYILFVGSEQPRKNFLALLRAFGRLRKRVPDVHLWKVGQPEILKQRAMAMKLIEELGLTQSVTFFDYVDEETLPYFYNASDIFVFPSLYEGFGFPPLEAMSCGTPVICSDRTSLPEVVGDAAVLVDPDDEDSLVERMQSLLSDDDLRAEYRRRGPEHARDFRWDVTARRTIDVYRHVLGIS